MQLYKVKLDIGGYLAASGKVRQYSRGEAIKKARRFKGKIEKGMVSQQGLCPKCEREIREFRNMEIQDFMAVYRYTCSNCKFKGKEWFELAFKYHTDAKGEAL